MNEKRNVIQASGAGRDKIRSAGGEQNRREEPETRHANRSPEEAKPGLAILPPDYPDEETICAQAKEIARRALPRRRTIGERILKIYWGPGLRAIFYQSRYAWLITGFLSIGIGYFLRFWEQSAIMQMRIGFLVFPIGFLVFAFCSCRLDEQDGLGELKASMHYSTQYLVSLRMFYSGILLILLDILLLAVLGSYRGQTLWRVAAAGASSLFLFAMGAVWLYHRFSSSALFGLLFGVWIAAVLWLVREHPELERLFLEQIPVAVHLMVACGCFVLFTILIGKVEERDAYTFAY